MPRSKSVNKQPNPVFEIVMDTNVVLHGELYPQAAPNTVGNFIQLANSGFYDGSCFHRCIKRFIAQAGRLVPPLPYCIRGEFEFNGFKQRGYRHERGSLSLSRGNHYDSGSSEFFIVVTDDFRELGCLDGAYAVFGKLTDGLKTAEAIAQVETDEYDQPIQEQIIRRVRVETFGYSYPFETIEPPGDGVDSHMKQ